MRGLIRGTKGGVGVIFATLLGSGALLAIIALGVDFGRVYLEQQTLRNASSSAALALATACSNQSAVCSDQGGAEVFVQEFLDSNSPDGTSALQELCGSAPLNACAQLASSASDCVEYLGVDNLVRVTASSKDPGMSGLELFFTSEEQVQLWQCSQASWSAAQTGDLEFQTSLDLGIPVCDFPGDQTPVVWFQFQNKGNSPGIPREASCDVMIGGQLVSAVDYANGMAGLDLAVGTCSTPATLVTAQIVQLGETNLTKLCSKSVEDFLDSAIVDQLEIPVALLGQFVRHGSNQIDFDVAGKTNIRVLGYVLSDKVSGGQTPPGGWQDYPASAPKNLECGTKNPCIYGFYTTELLSGSTQNKARLVFK